LTPVVGVPLSRRRSDRPRLPGCAVPRADRHGNRRDQQDRAGDDAA